MFKQACITAFALLATHAPLADEQRLSAEVLWQLDRVGAPVISPDGDHVVVPVTSFDQETDEPSTRLWLLPADERGTARAITADGMSASSPVFAPDGSALAFVSKRGEDDHGQIYLLPMSGPGEATRLTQMPTGASALRWVGEHIYFISNVWPEQSLEQMAETLAAKEEDKVSGMVWSEMPYSYFDHYLDEARQRHLYRVPAAGGDIEPLTITSGLQLSRSTAGTDHYDVSPDGKTIALVANSQIGAVYPNYDVYLLPVGSDTTQNLTVDNPATDSSPQFSPNGETLVYLQQRIPGFYGDQQKLMAHDLSSGDTVTLHADWDRSVSGPVWMPNSRGMIAAIDDAGTRRLYTIPTGSGKPRAITAATDYGQPSVADDGTLVALNQSALNPSRVVLVNTRNGATKRLDAFNDEQLANVSIGTHESVTYKGADGKDIQMWVHYPPGFDKDKQYPLMLLIHGGPHGAVTDNFHYRWNAQTFASWGYVTAWPNFHGSSGFGQDFTDSINPDWITKPYADVIAAAEWLIDKPWVDGERTVAAGGSYGGYLSSIILGKEHPFNALVIHAAVYDLYAQMSADFAVHDQRFGSYWDNPEIYREISPHYFADKFDTPSLIIHGQNDLRVPVGQGFELFRTLQTRGVDSRMVYYPDENHWVLKRSNSLHWYQEVKDWVSKYAAPGPR
ncbi:MAG: S9 family peptidase [Pseudomonadota bacterium]